MKIINRINHYRPNRVSQKEIDAFNDRTENVNLNAILKAFDEFHRKQLYLTSLYYLAAMAQGKEAEHYTTEVQLPETRTVS